MAKIFTPSRDGEFRIQFKGSPKEVYASSGGVISYGKYSWENSVTLDFLHYVDSEGGETPYNYKGIHPFKLNNHGEFGDKEDNSIFEPHKDGLLKMTRIILPNQIWADAMDYSDSFNPENTNYYYDTDLNKIYKRLPKSDEKVLTSKIEVPIYDIDPSKSTIIREDVLVFVTPYLTYCYNMLIKDLLKCVKRAGECPSDAIKNQERNRDIINMFITSMKYSREMDRFYEAQRTLEQLDSCNMICNGAKPTNLKRPNDCGC